MSLNPFPYCEVLRPGIEFRRAGGAPVSRPIVPSSSDEDASFEYLYFRTSFKGIAPERCLSVFGGDRFFNCSHDTVSDKIFRTLRAGEAKRALVRFVAEISP